MVPFGALPCMFRVFKHPIPKPEIAGSKPVSRSNSLLASLEARFRGSRGDI
jgi:hypothetical protein